MTQPRSAHSPPTARPGHSVGLISLTVHDAPVVGWGRPWRRHALSYSAPHELTLQGTRLSMQPLRSWLHMLAKAGFLDRPDSAPTRLMATDDASRANADMRLNPDFAQAPDSPRQKTEKAQAAPASDELDLSGQDRAPPSSNAVAEIADTPEHPSPGSVSAADERRLYEFLDAMVASLEEEGCAAAISAVAETPPEKPVTPAVDASMAANSNLEAAMLQGNLIQKESVMTEMHDVIPEAEISGVSAPISSAELQEVVAALSVPQLDADPDDVLSDVQSTLNSLAGMAQGLSQQKQAAGRLQEELDEWSSQLQERERQATDKEERLLQLENHLKEAKANLDRMAAENNRLLAERSEALKDLAQTVDLRDKATLKRAESIQAEQQRIDEQSAAMRARASELDERESALKRKSEELATRLKQLQSAKDKFSAIVKSFNETVQFNSTLSAISKTVIE